MGRRDRVAVWKVQFEEYKNRYLLDTLRKIPTYG